MAMAMKAEHVILVNDLKSRTFGVEIEMYGITRKAAARRLARLFGTNDYRYVGGTYDMWIVRDQQGREWKLMYDSSIQARTSQEKCELVTPILVYSDMDLLQDVVREMRHAGAKSDPAHSCGVHIHIGASGMDAKAVRMLSNLMAAHETAVATAIGIDSHRMAQWCRPTTPEYIATLDKERPRTMDDLKNVWYDTQAPHANQNAHYNSSRYHMLNLHALFTKGTVEFRMFQFDNPTEDRKGGLHAGQLKSYIQFALGMVARACRCKSARPDAKILNAPNPVNAMRLWLGSLGMIGDEFNTARMFFTRGLKTSRMTEEAA